MAHFETKQLTCVRGQKPLLVDLNLSLQAGDVLHVMGPNGSGKTSLLRTLCGLQPAGAGEITWNGCSIVQDRDLFYAHLLYLGHRPAVKAELTVAENLTFYAGMVGKRLDETLQPTLAALQLHAIWHAATGHLSEGQRRRVALARLMLARASLWLLDEPFTALDQQGVAWLTQQLSTHAKRGGIVIFTSHQACDIEGSVHTLELSHVG